MARSELKSEPLQQATVLGGLIKSSIEGTKTMPCAQIIVVVKFLDLHLREPRNYKLEIAILVAEKRSVSHCNSKHLKTPAMFENAKVSLFKSPEKCLAQV